MNGWCHEGRAEDKKFSFEQGTAKASGVFLKLSAGFKNKVSLVSCHHKLLSVLVKAK